ncbi:endospore germination permease [Brevibacillus sp. BC25]|uniref:GerAB/ArcD/ProY family transporter n=1 Tax=Brevibacillus sp. BC25 TaxID=1144308 RepID=UPI000270E546|nr:endospore germination permease [Brevibacillus sp. BC25]EJL30426.1 spore germination protein, amino acid permease [Brevibacillus sp. BC25]
MKVDGKIGIGQAIMVMMLTIGITNHVTVIPLLLSKAGRDAWLSVLLAGIPFSFWAYLLFVINRSLDQQSLYEWISQRSGKIVSNLLLVPIMICLYLMALTNLIDTQTWTTVNYLPRTPEWVTALALIGLCVLASIGGMTSVGITAGVLLPIVVLLGFFVAFGNIPKKDYSLLLPLFQNGFRPLLHGMLYVGGGFTELFLLLLLQHHVRKPFRLVHFFVMLGITLLLTLSPLTGAIAEFGPVESSRQRFPAFEQWRLLTIGKDIENMEFFSIFQWLSGAFIRITLCLILLGDLITIRTRKQRKFMMLFFGGSMIALTSLPYSDMQFVAFLSRVYYPLYFVIMVVVSLALILISLRKPSRQEGAPYDP